MVISSDYLSIYKNIEIKSRLNDNITLKMVMIMVFT